MDMTKLQPQMAIRPLLASSAGMIFTLIALGIHWICRPCHCFEESILQSKFKRFSKLSGKGGNLPVHGVLGKIGYLSLSYTLIPVFTDD
jgi:hypothetical protein